MIKANDAALRSWVPVAAESDFPIQNLPFGVFKTADKPARAGVAIGDFIFDLAEAYDYGLLDGIGLPPHEPFHQPYLNEFMALGRMAARQVRNRVSDLLNAEVDVLRDNADLRSKVLVPMAEAELCMPVQVRDYTDFYSSIEHATNVGTMFRDPNNALLPNWRHLPVGYHGRASSIVLSGTPVHRPKGQLKAPDAAAPTFGPTQRLDFELEMAFVTCKENGLGNSITTQEADDYIWGFVLFNDWSARDIQVWEYQPLGPFLAKNFASSISPWVVTLDALEPFRVPGPKQDPAVLPYLMYEGNKNFDINLEVSITPAASSEQVVCQSNFKYMYWNPNQQLAHHTVSGCNLGVGDMYASGTISGPTPNSYGSMLELAWKGTKPLAMPDGTERRFIHDHDTVTMRGYAQKEGLRIGFGEVATKVLPANTYNT